MQDQEKEHLPHHHTEASGIVFDTPDEHAKREETERAREQAEHGRLQTRFNKLMLWMQSATVFLGATALCLNAYQIRLARLSTDAATQGTKLATNSYIQTSVSTRAWLTADVRLIKRRPSKGVLIPSAFISNEGHSPAVVVTNIESGFSNSELLTSDTLKFEQLTLIHPIPEMSLIRVGPSGVHVDLPYYSDMHKTFHPNLSQNRPMANTREIKQFLARKYLYVWGGILYEDAFHHKHLFTFCYTHAPSDPPNVIPSCSFLNTIGDDLPDDVIYVTPTAGAPRLSDKKEDPPQ